MWVVQNQDTVNTSSAWLGKKKKEEKKDSLRIHWNFNFLWKWSSCMLLKKSRGKNPITYQNPNVCPILLCATWLIQGITSQHVWNQDLLASSLPWKSWKWTQMVTSPRDQESKGRGTRRLRCCKLFFSLGSHSTCDTKHVNCFYFWLVPWPIKQDEIKEEV